MDRNTWTYKFIGDICEILNGFAFKSSEYVEQGIRVIRITNVQKGHIEDENPVYYPYDAEPLLKKYILKENDILMSLTGNVGRVGLLPENMLPAALNQRVACLRLKTEEVYFPFLYHYFNSDFFEQKCIESSRGIAQKNMSTEWLKEQTIPVPPLPTQRAIVAELDTLNEILDKKRQQLKELDTLAQSIFYDMFGDPVENEKGWEVKKMGEVAQMQIGVTYKPENVVEKNGTIVLRSSNIQDSELDFEDIVRIDCPIKPKMYVQDGDILMCSRNGSFRLVGKVAKIQNLPEPMTYGAFMTIIRSEHNQYLFSFFKSSAFREQLVSAQTATINQITTKMLNGIIVCVPPLPLQQSFAKKIEAIEKQKELINASIKDVEMLLNARMGYYFGE